MLCSPAYRASLSVYHRHHRHRHPATCRTHLRKPRLNGNDAIVCVTEFNARQFGRTGCRIAEKLPAWQSDLPAPGAGAMVRPMHPQLSILHPDIIICVDGNDSVLHDHSLAIENDRIIDIAPRAVIQRRYADQADEIDLSGHLLIPGLINAHTHLAMNLLRGYADDLPLMTWLNEHIWPAEGKHVDHDFVSCGTRLAMAECLRGGVTCINDMYFFPEAVATEAMNCGIRASIGLIVLDFPSAWATDAAQYLEKGVELHNQLRNNPLLSTMLAPHAPYTVSDQPLLEIARLRDRLGIGVHMHVHETADEVEQAVTLSLIHI